MTCIRPCYAAIVAFLCLLGAQTGCSGAAIATHPVKGKVDFADGDMTQLSGSTIEFMHDADPLMRASGRVMNDGTFAMETLYKGEILAGVPEGSYKARLLPPEEDESGKRIKGIPVHKRFLDFKTSGLSVSVPPSSDVTLKVSKS